MGIRVPGTRRESSPMKGYCVKCRAKKEIENAKRVKLKNGRPALKGTCPDCGTNMTRFLKQDE